MRLLFPARLPAFMPVWLGWAVMLLFLAIFMGGNTSIVDVYGGLAVVLAAVAAIVSVRYPVVAAGFIVAALLLNAVSPDNVVSGLYVLLLWIPVTVGAQLGLRPLVWVVLGQLSLALLLEWRVGLLRPLALCGRVPILLVLFGAPGFVGMLAGRYWGAAIRVKEEMKAKNELFRRALSRDLHDTAVHATTSMVMRANQALLREGLDEQSRQDFQFIADTGREATRTLRKTLTSLRENDLLPEAPSVDAAWFRARLNGEQIRLEQAGFAVRSTTDVMLTDVSPQVLATLGRLVVEIVNNVLRHGKPGSEVTLMLENSGSTINLMCSNLLGEAEPDRERVRLGVVGMSELTESQGGTLTARAMGAHWVTHVSIPTTGNQLSRLDA
ncbi:histidine kinase [Arachnia propionica]|uniref:sensor histidine kinase n=1 Tax=Arachnia propionica TaxID=1750 RepID=UPI0030CC032F